MNEVRKELDEAYRLLSSIPVQGDAVDLMAAARVKIRKVFTALKEAEANG